MGDAKCVLCNGHGYVQELDDEDSWEDVRCPECGGTGVVTDEGD